jgi:hypothetical protein
MSGFSEILNWIGFESFVIFENKLVRLDLSHVQKQDLKFSGHFRWFVVLRCFIAVFVGH